MSICYIIGAGSTKNTEIILTEGDFVIAADAGFKSLPSLGVEADMVVGDFDSLGYVPPHKCVVRHPAEKDDTDMLLAVKTGMERGFERFVLLGGIGGRLDHTLANLQVLTYIARRGARGVLAGEGTLATAVSNGEICFDASCSGTVSVFCSGDSAEGVYLEGLKYPLTNAVLTPDMPLGVSNEFTGKKSAVRVTHGTVIVVVPGQELRHEKIISLFG